MKKIGKNKLLLLVIIALIIIAGIVVTVTIGFNFDLKYQEANKIEINLKKTFEISDIKNIAGEIFPNQQVIIQKIEIYEDTFSIITKEITEEQKMNFITKVNEKYGTEISTDDITIENIPHTRGRDIIEPYIIPFTIATVIILAYIAIRYYKLDAEKNVLKTLGLLILTQVILYSVIAITRIPIGILTLPMTLSVYFVTLFYVTNKFEKKLKEKNGK